MESVKKGTEKGATGTTTRDTPAAPGGAERRPRSTKAHMKIHTVNYSAPIGFCWALHGVTGVFWSRNKV